MNWKYKTSFCKSRSREDNFSSKGKLKQEQLRRLRELSLLTGTMPETLKVAELVPVLKKHDADH